jgi:SAM-dependent methyltransferase
MKIAEHRDRLKVFVVIASYGEKNIQFLRHVVDGYQKMAMDLDIVVTSETPKSVDLGVEVIVGLPTTNPYSLPFVHQRLFVDKVDQYDLYIYTEDDIGVTEDGIRAFLRITEVLQPNELAGYVRYESDSDGTRYLPDVHGRFHWRPESVRRRGEYLVAEFTNEHSGFYILTNHQLRSAIASGRYLAEPYHGRYDMLESAATHVYVNCGFRKVICISDLDSFLVHHMPNKYIGHVGTPIAVFREQIETLTQVGRGSHPAATLCPVEPRVFESKWGKRYDETLTDELLKVLPAGMNSVLSIGCGSGEVERELQRRGAAVTVFPLDSVVGASAARQGLEVVHGSLEQCLSFVSGRAFDCVIVTNLIHLLPQVREVVERIGSLVAERGTLIVEGQNFEHLPVLIRRALRRGQYSKLRTFAESGLHTDGVDSITRMLQVVGFEVTAQQWSDRHLPKPLARFAGILGRFGARAWIVRAERKAVHQTVAARERQVAQV